MLPLILLAVLQTTTAEETSIPRKIRDCLGQDTPTLCLKEKALAIINETIMSDAPLNIYGIVDIVKDPDYKPNTTHLESLPADDKERSLKLNSLLYEKLDEFIQSRSVKFSLGSMFEGRGKKGGKKGGMLMMGGLAMAGMMAQLFMGKIAMMAGAALIMAKIALMISTVIGIKKLGSGGGGSEHVVYTSGGDNHGGWHRSMLGAEDVQNLVYRGQMPEKNYNY